MWNSNGKGVERESGADKRTNICLEFWQQSTNIWIQHEILLNFPNSFLGLYFGFLFVSFIFFLWVYQPTKCEAIQGLGFRRGSYKCVCRKGYYFPDTTSHHKYFNGSLLEEEYEKLMLVSRFGLSVLLFSCFHFVALLYLFMYDYFSLIYHGIHGKKEI